MFVPVGLLLGPQLPLPADSHCVCLSIQARQAQNNSWLCARSRVRACVLVCVGRRCNDKAEGHCGRAEKLSSKQQSDDELQMQEMVKVGGVEGVGGIPRAPG